jgi:tRNA(fMet)-specific endonuclease VapC
VKKILLDTNAYTRLLTGEKAVLDALAWAETVYMSIFVLGELYAGFAGGIKERENKDVLRRFLLRPTVKVLNATSETAEIFGFVKSSMGKAGTPLPVNDLWIAAHAFEAGSRLVTYDEHFKKVAGLRLWDAV